MDASELDPELFKTSTIPLVRLGIILLIQIIIMFFKSKIFMFKIILSRFSS